MQRRSLFLVVSPKMDSNKKPDRHENGLVRMSKKVRTNLGFTDETVELWPSTEDVNKRLNKGKLLTIFQAYSSDIKMLRKMLNNGEITKEQFDTAGFVTSKVFSHVTGDTSKDFDNSDDIWISKGVHDLTIGSDPEFLLLNNDGLVVPANSVMPMHGPVGCDGAMAELRPEPAITPELLVQNVLNILEGRTGNIEKVQQYKWVSGCFHDEPGKRNYSLGGHIHLGNPRQIMSMNTNQKLLFFSILNKIIDELLSLIMVRLDGEKGKLRRTGGSYGKYGYYGGFRTCDGRLEHRTLSGMWLTHPKIALAVFGTVKAITEEVYKLAVEKDFDTKFISPGGYNQETIYNDSFNTWGDIPVAKAMKCTASSKYMREFLNESKASDVNRSMLTKWHNKMKSFSTYSYYESYIKLLLDILSIPLKEVDKIDGNIKRNWLEKTKLVGL